MNIGNDFTSTLDAVTEHNEGKPFDLKALELVLNAMPNLPNTFNFKTDDVMWSMRNSIKLPQSLGIARLET